MDVDPTVHPNRRTTRRWLVGLIGLSVALTPAGVAVAKPPAPALGDSPTVKQRYSTEGLGLRERGAGRMAVAAAGVTPPVGTVRQWLGSDDAQGSLYRKDYTLRAVGAKTELWVANDLAFPAGDCRGAVAVTDSQAGAMVTQFDTVIHPRESAAFSVPPDRDGSNAFLGPDANGNGGDYGGAGDRVVVLVDNIRDTNFYSFPAEQTSTPGFFAAQFNELFDRNVVSLDAFDWLHRTTATPPNATTADPCTSRPASPYAYEKTLAHEYSDLLQYASGSASDDPNTVWVSEGLSTYAESLTGYANPKKTVLETGADRRILCYQGFGTVSGRGNPKPGPCGGPENSLTVWGDQGSGDALLADQGQVWSFVLYLRDRFGTALVKTLHGTPGQGLARLQTALDLSASGTRAADVIRDFQLTTLLDVAMDTKASQVTGIARSRVVSAAVTSTVNLTNPTAYAAPGAQPNGADFVWLRDARGRPVTGSALTSLGFVGDRTLPPAPLQWSVVADNPDRPGNPTLWSGDSNNRDVYAVAPVTVPTADPVLRYLASYGAEIGYDYGYTVISTDGGLTYTPLPGDRTEDGPEGPGLSGTTTGFEPHSFDLSAYAGQSVLLGFRYVSDGGVNEGGWYVDDVRLGANLISDGSSTGPFLSRDQARPTPTGFTVQLVGVDVLRLRALVQTFPGRTLTRSRAELAAFKNYPVVVAVVSDEEPTERYPAAAAYRLTVNGVVQPGGGPAQG